MTADRPPELRDVGAAQTIDQNRLYGAHAKWFVEVALPESTPQMLRYARALAGRAVAQAREAPSGPVHLNFPFRDPLVPAAGADLRINAGRADGRPWVKVTRSRRSLDDRAVSGVAGRVGSAQKPLIVCGPQYDDELAEPLADFARSIGAPILADPLSQLRWGSHDRKAIIDRYDALLRHEKTTARLEPDLIIRIGGTPTSKALLQFLERQGSAPLIVIAESQWPDPSLLAEEMVRADPATACAQLAGTIGSSSGPTDWLDLWLEADKIARVALEQHACTLAESFEGAAVADIVRVMPDASTLFVSNSMPVRDVDAFASGDERTIRVLCNRGANGIDGVVSTALGVAAAADRPGPLVLIIGDLALYHDMNGLLAAKLHGIDATIVIMNNDGGGIFSFLPQAQLRDHFEKLFGTPHGLDFEGVASIYDATYALARDSVSLRRCVSDAISGGGLQIVEMRTERARNVVLHREAWEAVALALDKA
jgi:2-succinyl-5-enolpyruvyl-6-hydroxy-3-cyclohexene-1-carboxylate synthase